MPERAANSWLGAAAEQCVACGLCIPQCPTWQVQRNEAHSPRGRIMLIKQLAANGAAPADAAEHLDACLGCGRCEQVCPAGVPFTAMLVEAKSRLPAVRHWTADLVLWLAGLSWRQRLLSAALALARLLSKLHAARLLGSRLHALALLAPAGRHTVSASAAAPAGATEVSLVTGCFSLALDADAMSATAMLLRRCGYRVSLPKRQQCCGALFAHAGQPSAAQRCRQANEQAFAGTGKIAATASSCAQHLCALGGPLARRSCEAGALIAGAGAALPLKRAPGLRVLVHQPCTQSRTAEQGRWVYELLEQIPAAQVVEAAGNETCCGAGGLAFLTYRRTAEQLADAKVGRWQAQAEPGAVIVSSNYGCRALLRAAMDRAGMANELAHPLTLFAKQLRS